ncbi:MAG: PIN domain-containing protein [Candidatus Omnitrophica bacterium]|nr:PIN domain-containing protein [Candidatus Omnitrophota bacterium]
MTVLLDTNVLIHAANAASPVYALARQLRDQAVAGTLQACLSPQNLWEFYAVVTNPKRIHPALSAQEALHEVSLYMQAPHLRVLVPQPSSHQRALTLLRRHPVTGKGVFDVYLVATMLDHGVSTIYTENVQDFRRYPEIEVINPFAISTKPSSRSAP